MFGYYLLDLPQFLCREAPTTFQTDGVKPHLRLTVVTLHMNMRRFLAIAGVEEKAVRTTPQDCGHRGIAKPGCSSGNLVPIMILSGRRAWDLPLRSE